MAKRFSAKERASYWAGYDAGWLAAHQKVARSFNKARRSR